MGYYCGFCGTYHEDGEVCNCQEAQAARAAKPETDVNSGFTQGSFNQGTFNQGTFNQGTYNQGNFNQNTYNQGTFNQPGNGQNNFGQGTYNQFGNGQNNFGQGGYNQNNGFRGNMNNVSGADFKEKTRDFAKRVGFGEGDTYGKGAYEDGTKIVPDCLDLSDEEKLVKQYNVAKMNNRVFGIPIEWAVGKLAVTNKRLIFRGPGSGIAGRTCLNYEFSVDEIAGVTVNRRYVFQAWALGVGMLLAAIGAGIYTLIGGRGIIGGYSSYDSFITTSVLVGLIFGVGGAVPFFLVNKRWFLKLLGLGASVPALAAAAVALRYGGGFSRFISFIFILATIVSFCCLIFTLIRASLRPDLVLEIQGKTAIGAIRIHRRTLRDFGVFGSGYTEILPGEDAEKCVREINAIITDIQKLGDYAVEKWNA